MYTCIEEHNTTHLRKSSSAVKMSCLSWDHNTMFSRPVICQWATCTCTRTKVASAGWAHTICGIHVVLHLGLEGCSQPRELWFVDILMYTYQGSLSWLGSYNLWYTCTFLSLDIDSCSSSLQLLQYMKYIHILEHTYCILGNDI